MRLINTGPVLDNHMASKKKKKITIVLKKGLKETLDSPLSSLLFFKAYVQVARGYKGFFFYKCLAY